jgi:formylglycine-generating enzyme required for sulfatase activity
MDLAGNVSEWVGSIRTGERDPAKYFRGGWRIVRGGNWSETPSDDVVNFVPMENARPAGNRSFTIGLRCLMGQ